MRVDLFDIEIESLRWFSTFTQRSLGDAEEVQIAPAAELAAEHRELAEIAALSTTRRTAPTSRSCCPSTASARSSTSPRTRRGPRRRRRGDRARAADHWHDVCAAFHDADAHHLYVTPEDIEAALDARARVRLSLDRRRPALRVPRPGRRPRRALAEGRRARAREARALRLPHGRHVAAPRRRRARRLQPRPPDAAWLARAIRRRRAGAAFAVAPPARRLHRRRLPARRRSPSTACSAAGAPSAPAAERRPRRRGALRSFADLRTGDIVVHEDHGIARFAGFDTKTVAGVTRDYLDLEFAGNDRVFMPVDQLAKICATSAPAARTRRSRKLGGSAGSR